MKANFAVAALMGGLVLAGGAQAQSITLSCTNANNPAFPVSIDLAAGTGSTRGTLIGSILVTDASVRIFLPEPGYITEFEVSRITLATRDRAFSLGSDVMGPVLAMPRNTPSEHGAAARRMADVISTRSAAWNAEMTCKKVERAF